MAAYSSSSRPRPRPRPRRRPRGASPCDPRRRAAGDAARAAGARRGAAAVERLQEVLSGLAGGAAQRIAKDVVLFPIDTVKVRLQTAGNRALTRRAFSDPTAASSRRFVVGVPAASLFFGVKDGLAAYARNAGVADEFALEALTVALANGPYWAALAGTAEDAAAARGGPEGAVSLARRIYDEAGLAGFYAGARDRPRPSRPLGSITNAPVVASRTPPPVADKKGAVAGVFDGCGGARASRACADLLGGDEDRRARRRRRCRSRRARRGRAGPPARGPTVEPTRSEGPAVPRCPDASTALVARVNGNDVAVGWLGDSRAVLAVDDGKGGLAALDLSVDHKASNPREAKRVRAAGGFVGRTEQEARASGARALLGRMAPALAFRAHKRSAFRVYPGGIALTRCVGARPLKFKNLVTATPETFARPCDGAEAFLILACDGVWDVLDGAAAVKCCAAVAPEKAAETLVYHAHNKGSTDNLTAVVLSWP
ncbi:protein serine/threonine phosphatase [Aureococcus anophagefferens]|uniref:Protein serine/threonine phosphatase n=1 Tax=Aureococcus anophagefferens TaxID=44056 RepID=A0ABR1FRQ3_AURAN